MSSSRRNTVIVVSVLLLHVAALWALQSGLLRKAVEIIVPVEVLSEFISPPSPQPSPPAPLPPPRAAPPPKAESPTTPTPVLPRPAETLPTKAVTAAPADSPSPTTAAASPSAAPAPASAAAAPPGTPTRPPKVELPSSDAQYLRNPKPTYPALSKRLGEQGKVVIRVLIGADGGAQQAEIQQSSGFERLDQAALKTVLSWRFVPGKRGGVPEAMWFSIPINFLLE